MFETIYALFDLVLWHPICWLPALLMFVLPWNAFVRLCACLLLVVVSVYASLPPAHWSHGFGYALAILSLVSIAVCWTICAVVRVLFQYTLRRDEMHVRRVWGDAVFQFIVEAYVALIVFLTLKVFFSGTGLALFAHGLVIILAIMVRRFPGCALGLVLLCAFSLHYPVRVTQAAETFADDAPYCIYLPFTTKFDHDWRHFTFLTMRKGTSAHAVIVTTSASPLRGQWSYRQGAFFYTSSGYQQFADITCPTD